MLVIKQTHKNAASGFSLVELMVAMVLSLIVIGAVIALVLSMIRANNQTIAATRLTQELRALASLMAADIRRAGGLQDPLTSATANAGSPQNPFAAITIPASPDNNCIQYAYEGAEGGNFHAIGLSGAEIRLAAAGAVPTCGTGTRLSSPQVSITGLAFTQVGRRIDITLTGELSNNNEIRRSYSQSIYVRSVSGI